MNAKQLHLHGYVAISLAASALVAMLIGFPMLLNSISTLEDELIMHMREYQHDAEQLWADVVKAREPVRHLIKRQMPIFGGPPVRITGHRVLTCPGRTEPQRDRHFRIIICGGAQNVQCLDGNHECHIRQGEINGLCCEKQTFVQSIVNRLLSRPAPEVIVPPDTTEAPTTTAQFTPPTKFTRPTENVFGRRQVDSSYTSQPSRDPTCNCNENNDCPPGPQGEPGEAGMDGMDGEDGVDGKDGIDAEPFIPCASDPCTPCPAGERGPKGPPGSRGPAGRPGADGDDGTPGKDGDPGPPGSSKGDRGPDGSDGSRGPKGSPGEDGRVGGKGEKGRKGSTGPRGDAGPQGSPGEDASGQGSPGDTGPQGPTGDAGEQGSDGPPGPPGEPGRPGNDAQYCPCPARSGSGTSSDGTYAEAVAQEYARRARLLSLVGLRLH